MEIQSLRLIVKKLSDQLKSANAGVFKCSCSGTQSGNNQGAGSGEGDPVNIEITGEFPILSTEDPDGIFNLKLSPPEGAGVFLLVAEGGEFRWVDTATCE